MSVVYNNPHYELKKHKMLLTQNRVDDHFLTIPKCYEKK
jgi:hypothetical protein